MAQNNAHELNGTGRSETTTDARIHATRARAHRRFVRSARRHGFDETPDHGDDPDYHDRPRIALADSVRELIRDHPFKIAASATLAGYILGWLRGRRR